MEFTVAYLEKRMTTCHEYASAAPCSVQNVRSSQILHNVRAKTECCVRLGMQVQYIARAAELTGLSSFHKPRKPPRYAIRSSFASEMCSGGLRSFICGKFFRESLYFVVK